MLIKESVFSWSAVTHDSAEYVQRKVNLWLLESFDSVRQHWHRWLQRFSTGSESPYFKLELDLMNDPQLQLMFSYDTPTPPCKIATDAFLQGAARAPLDPSWGNWGLGASVLLHTLITTHPHSITLHKSAHSLSMYLFSTTCWIYGK